MFKYVIALAIAGTISSPVVAQATPQANPAQAQAQPAKAETVKKRVCRTEVDRLHNLRKVCKTVEVPAEEPAGARQTPNGQTGGNQAT
jgi:hypothetical protein